MENTAQRRLLRFACGLALAASAFPPSPAFADAARYGNTNVLMNYSLGRWPDAKYDSVNQIFLAVKGYAGSVQGTFVSTDGLPIGSAFNIRVAGNLTTARVCYAAGANKFLVTWLEEPNAVVGRLLRYTPSGPAFLSDPFLINADGGKYTDGGSPCEYSHTSGRFLVVWTMFGPPGNAHDIRGSLLDTNGVPVSSNFPISANANTWELLPSVAYNSVRNEFFVAFTLEQGPQYTAGARISAASGAITGPTILYQGIGLNNYAEVAYNPNADQYLVISWYFTVAGGADVWGRLISGDGTPLGDRIPVAANPFFEGGDGIGLAFNTTTNTYFAAFQGPSKEALGVQVSAGGVPGSVFRVTVSGATSDNFQPRVAGDPGRSRFLVASNVDFNRLVGQLISPDTAAAPPPPSAPPAPPANPKVLPFSDPSPASAANDGRQHLYWQSDDGLVARWGLADNVLTNSVTFQASVATDPHWRMVGTGDVNRDGKRDIFWRHDLSGALYVWIMDGDVYVTSIPITPGAVTDLNWRIASTKDLNGDGYPDFLWQNMGNGALAVWYLNGTTLLDGQMLTPNAVADKEWRIAGTGDVNRDGWLDIVWQHPNGTVALWFMRGAALMDGQTIMQVDQAWRVRSIADLNGDGAPDLIWQHTNGNWLAATLLNNGTVIDSIWINPDTVTAGWKIMGPK